MSKKEIKENDRWAYNLSNLKDGQFFCDDWVDRCRTLYCQHGRDLISAMNRYEDKAKTCEGCGTQIYNAWDCFCRAELYGACEHVQECMSRFNEEDEFDIDVVVKNCRKHRIERSLTWLYFISPPGTWTCLAGRAGWLLICSYCDRQIQFFKESFS